MRALLIALALVAVGLAGCTDNAAPVNNVHTPGGERSLELGKGGILGLVIDDRFRPIPEALVFLQPVGLTFTTNENGEWEAPDLAPGAYSIRVSADGHEAAPQSVNVREGEFTEASILARRTISEDGLVISQEYSVFIPCSIRFIANGIVYDCTLDQSGDSDRSNFMSNYTEYGDQVTYMVTEMKANKAGTYRVQIRNTDDGFYRYATATEHDTDYIKIVNQFNVTNEEHNWYGDNNPWDNDRDFQTILFAGAEFEEEAYGLGFCCGAGAATGIRAQFIQTVFIGEPETDVSTYCVLC